MGIGGDGSVRVGVDFPLSCSGCRVGVDSRVGGGIADCVDDENDSLQGGGVGVDPVDVDNDVSLGSDGGSLFFDATVPIGGGEVWVDVNFPLGGGVGDRVDVYFPLGGRSGGAFVAFYCFVGSRGGAYVGVDCPVGRLWRGFLGPTSTFPRVAINLRESNFLTTRTNFSI